MVDADQVPSRPRLRDAMLFRIQNSVVEVVLAILQQLLDEVQDMRKVSACDALHVFDDNGFP